MTPVARLALLLLILACCGCGSYFTGVGQSVGAGIVSGATSDDAKKKLSGLTADAVKAARDEALGPKTDAELRKLIADTDVELQKLVADTGAATRAQVNEVLTRTLQERLRQTIRLTIDEAFGPTTLREAGVLREELVGPPLQRDVDALIDAAAPHLAKAVQQAVQVSITPLKTSADEEAAKWKPIAIAFAVGTGFLLICFAFGVYVIQGHRKVIHTLLTQREHAEKAPAPSHPE
jgi:hypothetical protein